MSHTLSSLRKFGQRPDTTVVLFSDYFPPDGIFSDGIDFTPAEADVKRLSLLKEKQRMDIGTPQITQDTLTSVRVEWNNGANFSFATVTWPGGSVTLPASQRSFIIPGLSIADASLVSVLPVSALTIGTTQLATQVTSVSVDSLTTTGATVSWSGGTYDHVKVSWTGASSGMSGSIASGTTSYVATDLVSGGTYTFVVTAYNSVNVATAGVSASPVATTSAPRTFSSSPTVQWASIVDCVGGEARIVSCNVLSDDSVIVGGHYIGVVLKFINSDGSIFKTITTSYSSGGYFIARITTTGSFVWATRVEGWVANLANIHSSCTVSGDATVLALGSLSATSSPVRIYNPNDDVSTLAASSSSNNRPYIVRFNSDGQPSLIQLVAGAAARAFTTTSLDTGNFVYGIAVYTNTSAFSVYYPNGSSAGTYTTNNGNTSGGNNMFFLCSDMSTAGVWTLSITQLNTNKFAWRTSNGTSDGFVIAMTNAASAALVTNGNGTQLTLRAPSGSSDGYMILVSNTGVVTWYVQVSGTTGVDDVFDAFISNSSSRVFAVGNTAGNCSFKNADSSSFSFSISTASGFVVCTDMLGVIQWVARISGGGTVRSVCEISGYVVVVGTFTTSATFYTANTNTSAITLTGSGQTVFTACYNTSGEVLWATTGETGNTTTNIIKATSNSIICGGGFAGSSALVLDNADGSTGLSVWPPYQTTIHEMAFITSYA